MLTLCAHRVGCMTLHALAGQSFLVENLPEIVYDVYLLQNSRMHVFLKHTLLACQKQFPPVGLNQCPPRLFSRACTQISG